ncbi:uncharacterized protein LOC128661246 [Bombina bombina]|uniref:uncharacterized protein LOC128661246 n=1 Tax=Bombina bombina TaxID=8345 RepID=UPI00235AF18B|nr:uncharacterized protein LOC128661246 [Bombina bombina]
MKSKSDNTSDLDPRDQIALSDLESLLAENELELTIENPPSISPTDPKYAFKPKSEYMPSLSLVPAVNLFVKKMEKEIENLTPRQESDNLEPRERKALKELMLARGLVMKPADKGGNLVILDEQLYVNEVKRQLHDKNQYEKISSNPLTHTQNSLFKILNDARSKGIISQNEFKFMYPKFPVMPVFYILPKLHKNMQCPPGRPIVSGIGSITEKIGEYVDKHLRPFLLTLPSYVKDTTDLLKKLDGVVVGEKTILASLDVESLYSSIPHNVGLLAIKRFLETRGPRYLEHTEFMMVLLEFILKNNVFSFDGQVFRQIRGTAMGAVCAPTYACLHLGSWESDIFEQHVDTFDNKVLMWVRYVDDVLVLWDGTVEEFNTFVSILNHNDRNIFLTSETSERELNFLDITLKKEGLKIVTENYRKKNATNSILHANSSHPNHLKRGIPYGQFLRLRRNCSSLSKFDIHAQQMKERFLQRGYSNKCLKKSLWKARKMSRDDLLYGERIKTKGNQIRFISMYNDQWNNIRLAMKRNWHILTLDEKVRQAIGDIPQMAARKAQSLRDKLVKSQFVRGPSDADWLRKDKGIKVHSRSEAIEMFQNLVELELTSLHSTLESAPSTATNPTSKHNLSISEQQALKTLSNNKDIVVTPADKGGAVVILNTEDYKREVMDPRADESTTEMSCLGRPFSLGMLYDCREDKLIPGITLWNHEALREDVVSESQEETSCEIITSDTVSDKSSAMNINASLEASFLCGLVTVSGSATYMNDTKRSRNQARVTLKYSRTTKFEQLSMNHLGTKNMTYPDVFDKGTATHVVTGILYGAQAFFIFDRDVSISENTQDIQGNLLAMIKTIPQVSVGGQVSLSMNDKGGEQVNKITCTLHGDFPIDRNPVTYEDAIRTYRRLPKLLGDNGEKAVPVRVWLHPLNKLDNKAAKLVRDISRNLVLKAESVVQEMADVNMQCYDLMRHPAAETFPDIKKKITQFMELCKQFTLIFQNQLAQTLPSIRRGALEEVALVDILTSVEQSPFGKVHTEEFLTLKKQELEVVEYYMSILPNIPVLATNGALNKFVASSVNQYVVCYIFSSLNKEEPYLCDLSHCFETHQQKSENNVYEKKKIMPWFKVTDTSEKITQYMEAFKHFSKVNASTDKIKYIISSVPDQRYLGVSIYLYDNCKLVSTQFEPPVKPHLPFIKSKTHNSVELVLKPAEFGKNVIKSYTIEYRCPKDESWTIVRTEDANETVTIRGLKPNSIYQIRYSSVCILGLSEASEVLNEVRTCPTSPPEAIKVTAGSSTLTLHWKEPAAIGDGVTVADYVVEYKEDVDNGQQGWLIKKLGKKVEKYIIEGLIPMAHYLIRVSAECGDNGLSHPSDEINVSTLKEHIKHVLVKKSSLLKNEKPSVYQLPINPCEKPYQQYSLGEMNWSKTNKVILLIGATGTGKTTLINGMANYILGVDWEDDFRFKLVHEVTNKSEAHSQTSLVTVYQMNHEDGYNIPFTLTLIDTPGFGDTRGIEQDKKIMEAIHAFFTNDSDIVHIDAVCFVVQSSLAHTQKYILNSVFSIFGKDIKDNILILINFSDRERPPVLEAIKAVDLPYSLDSNGDPVHFKFNNSALFANNQTSNMSFNKMFWDMGKDSMEIFFTSLNQMKTKSLKLTKEVLKERKELEVTLQALHPQIKSGLAQLEAIRQTERALQQHRSLMEDNKDFEFEITVTVPLQKDTGGKFVTNCMQCNFTCHFHCAYGDDKIVKHGCAMTNGYCTKCPDKCVWSVHHNQKYRWIYEERKEKRTYEEIKNNFEKASGEVMTAENIFTKLNDDYKIVRQNVFNLINRASQSLTRLHEIALRPDPLTTTEYIDLMIESEKQEAKPRYQERIKSLTEVKETAEIIKKIEKGEALLPEEEDKLPEDVKKGLVESGIGFLKTAYNTFTTSLSTSKNEGKRFTN